MTLRRYRTPALLFLVLHLQACSSWYFTPLTPRQLITEERPSRVRITRINNTQLVIREPRIENDTIRGVPQAGGCQAAMADYDACVAVMTAVLPLEDVQMIEAKRFSALKTMGVPVLTIGIFYGVAFLAIAASGGLGPIPF